MEFGLGAIAFPNPFEARGIKTRVYVLRRLRKDFLKDAACRRKMPYGEVCGTA